MWCRAVAFVKLAPLAMVLLAHTPAEARNDGEDRGRQFAEENCARCHSVERSGESPLGAAPPFRTLGRLYSMKDLDHRLASGELGDHPTMPHWLIDPADVKDLVAYIGVIQVRHSTP